MSGSAERVEFRQRSRVKPESAFLREHAGNVTSQWGEDGMLRRLFELVRLENRFCVEFGAWDGKHFSNTWRLLNQCHWRGILIEGEPARFAELQRNYPAGGRATLINRYVGFEADALDALLATTDCPGEPDLMSIDVDGLDWHIWESLERYRPRVVVVEFNPCIPNDVLFVQARDARLSQGCSLLALVELGKRKGYELGATTLSNALFVEQSLFPRLGIADNDIDAMHCPGPYESRIFQLYDGTLVLSGCQRLVWIDRAIEREEIQVLPPQLRKYG
jgi:hypothetical protein